MDGAGGLHSQHLNQSSPTAYRVGPLATAGDAKSDVVVLVVRIVPVPIGARVDQTPSSLLYRFIHFPKILPTSASRPEEWQDSVRLSRVQYLALHLPACS